MTKAQAQEYATRIRLGEEVWFRARGLASTTYCLADGTPLVHRLAAPTGFLIFEHWGLVPEGFDQAQYEAPGAGRPRWFRASSGAGPFVLRYLDRLAK